MYCVPSAGVLALELRRCTREGRSLPGEVRRADVVRCLAVLISCLEWVVLPGDGNYRLCSELNKMLALVLDEVLNFEPSAAGAVDGGDGEDREAQAGLVGDADAAGASTVEEEGSSGGAFFDFPLVDGMEPIPTESEDFLNWLDNAHWNNTVSLTYAVDVPFGIITDLIIDTILSRCVRLRYYTLAPQFDHVRLRVWKEGSKTPNTSPTHPTPRSQYPESHHPHA